MGKLKKYALAGLALFAVASVARAMVVKYNAYLVNETGLAYNKTYPLPLNSYGIDNVSFTSVASSVTFSNQTFTDGQKSTGTITVTSNTGLAAVAASDSLRVLNTADPGAGATITVNGTPLIYGVHWFYDSTASTVTAVSIKQAIATYIPGVSASTGSNSTVFSTATVSGAYGNNMTLVSNSSTITVNSANFTGGKDAASISIAGTLVPFTPGVTSSNTATSIAQGINASSVLSALIVASVTTNGTVVYTTSTAVGLVTNYVVTSSTDSSLTVGGSTKTVTGLGGASIGQMWGGSDSAYTLVGGSATVITLANHGFTLGLPVLYTTPSSQAITGLSTGTTYYVIPVSAGSLSLGSSSANAQAGTAVVLTSSQSKTAADSFQLAPLAIAGTPSYKWQVSNDGSTWIDYTANQGNVTVSSVSLGTYNSTGTLTSWDLGPVGYAWIRLNVTAPTAGAISLKVVGNGKNSAQ